MELRPRPRLHKPRRRRRGLPVQLVISIGVGIALAIVVICYYNARLRPAVVAMATDHLSNQISEEIYDVVDSVLEEEHITYDSICTVYTDSQGNITALQLDMVSLNPLASEITTRVAEEFDDSLKTLRLDLPLGDLLPGLFFTGRGPKMKVIVQSVGNISASFENEFVSQGINQTLHRVVLVVNEDLRLLLPGGVHTFTDETRIILAETVLLGGVPSSLYNSVSQSGGGGDDEKSYYYFSSKGE